MKAHRIIILSAGLILAAALCHAAATQPIYLFPIEFKADDVPDQEREWMGNVYVEEMGAFFWLKPYHEENAQAELGSAGRKAMGCKSSACAIRALKNRGVQRIVTITVTRLKRRTYQVDAKVLNAAGRPVFQTRMIERGGASELKYGVPGLLEQLFAQELKKHSHRMTSIVETTAVTSTEADVTLDKGDEFLAKGKEEEALAAYEKAAEDSPELALPWVRKAELKLKRQKYRSALSAAEKALGIDPNNAQAHLAAGEAHQGLYKRNEAIEEFKAAVEKDEKLVKGHFLLGMVLEKMGRTAEAEAAFEKAVELAPQYPEVRVNLGLVYLKLDKKAKAQQQLAEAIRLDGELMAAYPPLAKAYEKDRKFDLAAITYERLGRKMGTCAECYYNAGRLQERTGDLDAAAKNYKGAIAADNNFLDAYFNLGAMYVKAGEGKKAVPYLKDYINKERRSDQMDFVKEAKKLLRQAGGK